MKHLRGPALFTTACLVAQLLPALPVHAMDCGNDPVYERNATGKTTSGVRLRSIACMEGSDVLTTLASGTVVHIIAETDGWTKVNVGGLTGWVGATFIRQTADGAPATNPTPTPTVVAPTGPVVGISEKDFKKLVAGNSNLLKRLKDKVVMRVQHKGQKYRIHSNGKLGVYRENDLKELGSRGVLEKTSTTPVASTPSTGTISLQVTATQPNTVSLAWTVNSVAVDKGFKVVYSPNANPVYPGNDYHYLSDPSIRSDVWSDLPAKTLHFRVCQYLGGACGVYSNDVAVRVSGDDNVETSDALYTASRNGLSLTITNSSNAPHLSWSADTSSNLLGYKVVRSQTNNDPAYPGDGYLQWITDLSVRSYDDQDAPTGTMYYRICALHDGVSTPTCGNVVTVQR